MSASTHKRKTNNWAKPELGEVCLLWFCSCIGTSLHMSFFHSTLNLNSEQGPPRQLVISITVIPFVLLPDPGWSRSVDSGKYSLSCWSAWASSTDFVCNLIEGRGHEILCLCWEPGHIKIFSYYIRRGGREKEIAIELMLVHISKSSETLFPKLFVVKGQVYFHYH